MPSALDRDAAEIFEALGDGQLLMFCGAGISWPAPSNLPLADSLVSRAATALLAPHDAALGRLAIRPEVFFSYPYRINPTETLGTIARLLQSRCFNTLHAACAEALRLGNVVVTTNFDTLIEEAATRSATSFTLALRRTPAARSVIFKIHGSLADLPSLALTIDQVGAGLGTDRAAYFRELLAGKTVLVLGYSGNDPLDILPVLREGAYRRVVWLDHASARPLRRARAPSALIKSLPRLTVWRGDTETVVGELMPHAAAATTSPPATPESASPAGLSDAEKMRAVAQILMHQDDYQGLCDFLGDKPLADDLHLSILLFEAESSISVRPPDWTARRDAILDSLFAAPPAVQNRHLPTMAKYNHRADRLQALYRISLSALGGDAVSPDQVEAAIETLYELVYNHDFAQARALSDAIGSALEQSPNTLLQARHIIEDAYLVNQHVVVAGPDETALQQALIALEGAAYLLSSEICNDQFFYWQARSNAGYSLMLLGRYDEARRWFRGARRYFHGLSYNNELTQLHHIAVLERLAGRPRAARRRLLAFRRLNDASGRVYWLGFAKREQALNLLGSLHTAMRAARLFHESAGHFDAEENPAEAEISRGLAARLAPSASGPPHSLRPAAAGSSHRS